MAEVHTEGLGVRVTVLQDLKKKKNPWLHAFPISIDTADGSNQ